MRGRRVFGLAATVAIAVALAAVTHGHNGTPGFDAAPNEQARTAFQLGMLRADGLLLPFATYDDGNWKSRWPADLYMRELPASVADVPRDWWGGIEPASWRLLPQDGGPPQLFKPTAPITIMIGSARRLALRTDHPPTKVAVPPFAIPYPKAGLAVAGDVHVEPIATVSRSAPAYRELMSTIRSAVNDAEGRTVNGLRNMAGWRHPLDRQAREQIAAELEAWYTSPLPEPGMHVSYIEAVKKYLPGPEDQGCGLETLITGWIHHNQGGSRVRAELKAAVTYCDRDRASYMLPLGRVVLRDRAYWIYQQSGRDHEWYVVAEATTSRMRVVAEYLGGGLPRW